MLAPAEDKRSDPEWVQMAVFKVFIGVQFCSDLTIYRIVKALKYSQIDQRVSVSVVRF